MVARKLDLWQGDKPRRLSLSCSAGTATSVASARAQVKAQLRLVGGRRSAKPGVGCPVLRSRDSACARVLRMGEGLCSGCTDEIHAPTCMRSVQCTQRATETGPH